MLSSSSLIKTLLKFSKLVGGSNQKTDNGSNYPPCLTLAFLPAFCISTLHPQQQSSIWIFIPSGDTACQFSKSTTRTAKRRGAALHPKRWTPPDLRPPALLCPPARRPRPAHRLCSPRLRCHLSLRLSPHLPFISTLVEHAFNKSLEILTARLVSKVCWFFLHKI